MKRKARIVGREGIVAVPEESRLQVARGASGYTSSSGRAGDPPPSDPADPTDPGNPT
jgi:hypothetical protein